MRTLIVGDVHGCRQELEELLEKFAFTRGSDQLIMVGDLINKGPDSPGTLDLVASLGGRCVRGNHEAKLIALAGKPFSQWTPKDASTAAKVLLGTGKVCKLPISELHSLLQPMAEQVNTFPFYLELDACTVVHAGLEPGKERLEDMSPSVLMTIRTWDGIGDCLESEVDPPWYECTHWPKPVVFGHWALKGLVDLPQAKGLDSGCVYGKQLTGWCPEENKFLQVQAAREYAPMKRD